MAAVLPNTQPSTAYVYETADLVAILEDRINCCVLQRLPDSSVTEFIRHLQTPIKLQQVISAQEDVPTLIRSKLPLEVNQLAGVNAFLQDVADVVEIYGLLMDTEQIGLRLVTLDRAMCPGFHVDKVGVRLVCTYKGPATQWLENDQVDRQKLGLRTQEVQSEDSGLVNHPSAIRSMQPFDIGLLKGEAWATQKGFSNEGSGVVHRSPQVNKASRLLLTLDAFA